MQAVCISKLTDCLLSDLFPNEFLEHIFNCLCSLQAVFAEVYELDVDEDVNKVLFALPKPFQSNQHTAAASMHGSKKSKGSRGSSCAKPACIDGSAIGVKLLMPCLLGVMPIMSVKQQSELKTMLNNLALCK